MGSNKCPSSDVQKLLQSQSSVLDRLIQGGGPFDLLLQKILLRRDGPGEQHADVVKESLKASDAIVCDVIKRVAAELEGGSAHCCLQETELEVCLISRLEQILELCILRLRTKVSSLEALTALSVIFNPSTSFNQTEAWSSRSGYSKTSVLAQTINYFGSCDGFELVRRQLRNARDLSIGHIAALLRPFGQCYPQLSADTVKSYFLPTVDLVCSHLLSCSDRQLFQQDIPTGELPSCLIGPRAAYVIVESVMNLLSVVKSEEVDAEVKVQYWQETILTRLKRAMEDDTKSASAAAKKDSAVSDLQQDKLLHACVPKSSNNGTEMDEKDSASHPENKTGSSVEGKPSTSGHGGPSEVAQEALEVNILPYGPLAYAHSDSSSSDHDAQPHTPPSASVIPQEVIIRGQGPYREVIPVGTMAYQSDTPAGPSAIVGIPGAGTLPRRNDSSDSSSLVSSVPRSASELGNTCRVCFEAETSPKNRLIRPCRCAGSAASIHRQCLVKWIHISGNRRCEVCNARFSYVPFSERMRGFMEKFRQNRRWRNAAFAVLVGLVVILYLIIFAVFPGGIMNV
ncbi:uncharacterized protein LOC110990965 [Acanthaster planci]|uniref:Uncharacterized protein LOC110990965 n=1 Tax=Acanthaster planci TaxID=133434 RepID=A0A8B8A6V7_ACAPL|nr:uncharacterized protein LOC110990965 [Acanthaster planci]XP_022111732.1 uncharacterized protein LOC110990965 [Acanthaster planci]XP_022111736.1 uncharacterized protein LOC110990965 [Acanthaster planci]XP_022111741.1 uncharacterized protein LOC110990965 [Acanthaster planci]XP_022111746.1 uncharacterized protein LOC110990965 [Acanthaster planci]XP_022111751.1 uncharacterized protein LOC110990965 [Acanthaster planci]